MLRNLPSDRTVTAPPSLDQRRLVGDRGVMASRVRVLSPLYVEGGPLEQVDADLGPRNKHFLFVTAPFGGLSAEVGRQLRLKGARVTRVLLSAGDILDWGTEQAVFYRDRPEAWSGWISDHIKAEGVTDLIVFGDSHPYAIDAMAAARAHGAKLHVLEEGYFRPHWITLERDGVNGSSTLSKDPEFYRRQAGLHSAKPFVPVGRITPAAVRRISAYHTLQYLGLAIFPHYRTPNPYTPLQQAAGHVRRYARQRLSAQRYQADLHSVLGVSGPIFLALLQRPGDSQLLRHSKLKTMDAFIELVVTSFAAHAPPEARLLFKAHPLDHGVEAHDVIVRRAAEACGVADRVFYTDVGHFPSLVRASVGVISVNSTGGLTAIEFQQPTIALGSAIYDMPGLTHQGGLASFWSAPEAPDPGLFHAFRSVVMARTQINGAYSTSHGVRLAAPEVAERILTA